MYISPMSIDGHVKDEELIALPVDASQKGGMNMASGTSPFAVVGADVNKIDQVLVNAFQQLKPEALSALSQALGDAKSAVGDAENAAEAYVSSLLKQLQAHVTTAAQSK